MWVGFLEVAIRRSISTNIININPANLDMRASPTKLIKSDFLAAICHDLKTPLSAIISFSELLKIEDLDPKAIKKYAANINKAALEMLDLVHDLLDTKQASSSDFSVNKSEVDVANLINRTIYLNNSYASRRKITITTTVDSSATPIFSDVKRLKQILTNLISNAIKYSKEDTGIKISARKFCRNNSEFLEITINDQGLGMTEWQVAIALQKYHIIRNDNSDNVDSFGLSLPIVKSLVELLGGMMEIKSKIHEGTNVNVRLVFPAT